MIILNGSKIPKLFYGDKAIAKVYHGSDLVYQNGPTIDKYEDFQRIQYVSCTISADNKPYIDTGFFPENNEDIHITTRQFNRVGNTNYGYYFGAMGPTYYRSFGLYYYRYSGSYDLVGVPYLGYNPVGELNIESYVSNVLGKIEHQFMIRNSSATYGTRYYKMGSANWISRGSYFGPAETPYYLFAASSYDGVTKFSTNKLKYGIYEFQIYHNSGADLVMDLVPVRRKSNGEVGFWDMVTNKFFGNVGTGHFDAGPDV